MITSGVSGLFSKTLDDYHFITIKVLPATLHYTYSKLHTFRFAMPNSFSAFLGSEVSHFINEVPRIFRHCFAISLTYNGEIIRFTNMQ